MQNKAKLVLVCAAVALWAATLAAQTVKDDIAGFSSLMIAPAPRQEGMGTALGATASDLYALYFNPAGMLGAPYFSVGAAHNQWIADFRSEFVGLTYRPASYALGLGISYGTVGDLERRTGPTPEPEGYFDLNDIVAGLSFAKSVEQRVRLGVTGKIVYQKIDIESGTGLAVDLGAQYLATPDLTVGASFVNLGTKLKLKDEEFDLPRALRAGASYRIHDLLVAGEVFYPTHDDPHVHLGGEYLLSKMVFLRAGVQTGYDEKTLSFGAGFMRKGFQIDYAYVPFKSDLGNTHRIALTYSVLKEE